MHLASPEMPRVRIVGPASLRRASLFFGLVSLASEIFDTVCATSGGYSVGG